MLNYYQVDKNNLYHSLRKQFIILKESTNMLLILNIFI